MRTHQEFTEVLDAVETLGLDVRKVQSDAEELAARLSDGGREYVTHRHAHACKFKSQRTV